MSNNTKCACVSNDAKQCLRMRSPYNHWGDGSLDNSPSELEGDEKCECYCHVEYEEEMREFYPEDWEVRP